MDSRELKNKKKRPFLKFLIIILISMIVVLGVKTVEEMKSKPETITYNQFLDKVDKKEVKSVSFKNGEDKMSLTLKNGKTYISDNPRTEDFKEKLLEKDVAVTTGGNSKAADRAAASTAALNLVLMVVIITFLLIMFRKNLAGKKAGVATATDESTPTIKFEQIAGNEEAKEEMKILVDFLKDSTKYEDMGIRPPSGVLMFGPPGTGKTLMAKAIAGEADVPFFYTSGSDFIEMFAGLGAKRVRDMFKEAEKKSPCIIFIDEVDAIGGRRDKLGRSSENDQTLNALLEKMDGFGSDNKILIIAATNRIDSLDPAFIRPGRFDKHIHIGLPDVKARKKILELYVKDKKVAEDFNLDSLAKITVGMAGADIEALINEAAIIAVSSNETTITQEHIDKAFYKIAMKGSPKDINRENSLELKLIAYHEAGHAVISKFLTERQLHNVTIVPSTSSAGGVTFSTPGESSLLSKEELLNTIKMLYGGRAAEEILMGSSSKVTSGASSDIKQATSYLKSYFSELGMSEKYGMVHIEKEDLYIEDMVELSKSLYEETLTFLKENESKLSLLAEALIEKETISSAEVDKLLG